MHFTKKDMYAYYVLKQGTHVNTDTLVKNVYFDILEANVVDRLGQHIKPRTYSGKITFDFNASEYEVIVGGGNSYLMQEFGEPGQQGYTNGEDWLIYDELGRKIIIDPAFEIPAGVRVLDVTDTAELDVKNILFTEDFKILDVKNQT